MVKRSILWHIKQLGRPVFTTHELSAHSGRSPSGVVQSLAFLEREGILKKVCRGIWAEAGNGRVSLYTLIPYLVPKSRAYVSFISALHLYGMIDQIPQTVTVASTVHSKVIKTGLGVVCIHQISPSFFNGFQWYKRDGNFLIAEPEKALIDSLYLSTRRKRQFGRFPELRFPAKFSFKKAKDWIAGIRDPRIRSGVEKRFNLLMKSAARSERSAIQ